MHRLCFRNYRNAVADMKVTDFLFIHTHSVTYKLPSDSAIMNKHGKICEPWLKSMVKFSLFWSTTDMHVVPLKCL